MTGVRQKLLISIAAASLLLGCNRRPPPIQFQRPPIPKPDAAVVFSGDLTGIPTVTLTPAAARRFVTIISVAPEIEERDGLKLEPYAAFTVEGTDYGWYGDYIGLVKTQGHRQKWLTWSAPEFQRMHQKLKDAHYKNSEELYFKALLEFEPPKKQ